MPLSLKARARADKVRTEKFPRQLRPGLWSAAADASFSGPAIAAAASDAVSIAGPSGSTRAERGGQTRAVTRAGITRPSRFHARDKFKAVALINHDAAYPVRAAAARSSRSPGRGGVDEYAANGFPSGL